MGEESCLSALSRSWTEAELLILAPATDSLCVSHKMPLYPSCQLPFPSPWAARVEKAAFGYPLGHRHRVRAAVDLRTHRAQGGGVRSLQEAQVWGDVTPLSLCPILVLGDALVQGCSPGAQLSVLKHLEQSVRKTQLWSPATAGERTGPQLLPLAWCPGKTTPFSWWV